MLEHYWLPQGERMSIVQVIVVLGVAILSQKLFELR